MKWLILIAMLLVCSVVCAEVYKWTDTFDNVHYSDCKKVQCPGSGSHMQQQSLPMDGDGLTIIKPVTNLDIQDESFAVDSNKKQRVANLNLKTNVFKLDCFQHPRKYLGENFDEFSDEVSVIPFSETEYQTALNFVSLPQGEWHLTVEETRCKGAENSARTESRALTGQVVMNRPSENVLLVSSGELIDKLHRKKLSSKTRWWSITLEGFQFGDNATNDYVAPQWRTQILSLGSNEIRFIRRARIGKNAKLRYLALYSLRKAVDRLIIEELVFINNVLSDKTRWILKR